MRQEIENLKLQLKEKDCQAPKVKYKGHFAQDILVLTDNELKPYYYYCMLKV
jgi:hypothetical protein